MLGDKKRYSKMELRRLVKSVLAQFDERELFEKSDLLSRHLLGVLKGLLNKDLLKDSETLFLGGYAPLKGEPDWFLDFEKEFGQNFAFPGISEEGQMIFLKAERKDLIVTKDFGVPLSVPPQKSLEVIPKLLIIPGLAFGKKGERLGRGKGFYDRYLENFSGIKVGVCFKEQIFDEIPMGPNDQYVDYIITDEEKMGPF